MQKASLVGRESPILDWANIEARRRGTQAMMTGEFKPDQQLSNLRLFLLAVERCVVSMLASALEEAGGS